MKYLWSVFASFESLQLLDTGLHNIEQLKNADVCLQYQTVICFIFLFIDMSVQVELTILTKSYLSGFTNVNLPRSISK